MSICFYELFKKTFTWDRTGGDQLNKETNPLLYKNVGADGVKTGYLAVEKYSLASSILKNERDYYCCLWISNKKFKKFRVFKIIKLGI